MNINDYNTLIPEILNQFRNEIFIETGCAGGAGIKVALECGFKHIYSCDIVENSYNLCKSLYKDSNVFLYHSDSLNFLETLSSNLNSNITFWLDAHEHNTPTGNPLEKELDIIKQKFSNNNTILIDDINLFGRGWAKNNVVDNIKQKLLIINPNYKIKILDRKCKYGGQLMAAHI